MHAAAARELVGAAVWELVARVLDVVEWELVVVAWALVAREHAEQAAADTAAAVAKHMHSTQLGFLI